MEMRLLEDTNEHDHNRLLKYRENIEKRGHHLRVLLACTDIENYFRLKASRISDI